MDQYLKDFAELVSVMKRLRATDGCPWDRAQNMVTLCPHIIEEAYELVDAIEKNDTNSSIRNIIEECGDLLLQCVFVATIAEEKHLFDIGEVSRSITNKLVRRHPRIFTGSNVFAAEEALADWEMIKLKEKEQNHVSDTSVLSGLPHGLPPVIKASRLQGKAAGVGFDWEPGEQQPIIDKIKEELDEVQNSMNKSQEELTGELGDLLFAVINLSRRLGVDPNGALSKTNEKFEKRFRYIEKQVEAQGGKWKNFSLDELETLWKEAKKSTL